MRKINNKILGVTGIAIIILVFSVKVAYASLININKDMQYLWIKSKPIAHRGLHNDKYPENSIGAFNNAVKNRYAIELDVYFTKDNKIVVIHDNNLKRLTGKDVNVKDVTYDELKKLTLIESKETIPLLSQVLREVNGKEPILIEIKTDNNAVSLGEAVYRELQGYKGQWAIQSFNPAVIDWYANNAPHIFRGILIGSLKGKDNLMIYNKYIINSYKKPDFISIDVCGIDDYRIEQLRSEGMIVLSWTIRSEDEAKKARVYSDNIIFESFIPHNIS